MGPVGMLAIKVAAGVIARRAARSATSVVGGAVVATGAAAAIDPELLELIPENLRGYAIAVIGIAVVLARHRREILAVLADLRQTVDGPR